MGLLVPFRQSDAELQQEFDIIAACGRGHINGTGAGAGTVFAELRLSTLS